MTAMSLESDRIHLDLLVLIILGWCNFLPIAARILLRDRWNTPVDFGLKWTDQRFLFGPHKTWRGVFFSVSGGALLGGLTAMGALNGFWTGFYSMLGDIFSSFLKRRTGIASGGGAPGLDQVPESLLPVLVLRERLGLDFLDVCAVVFLFSVLEYLISPILYKIHIRRNPH